MNCALDAAAGGSEHGRTKVGKALREAGLVYNISILFARVAMVNNPEYLWTTKVCKQMMSLLQTCNFLPEENLLEYGVLSHFAKVMDKVTFCIDKIQ